MRTKKYSKIQCYELRQQLVRMMSPRWRHRSFLTLTPPHKGKNIFKNKTTLRELQGAGMRLKPPPAPRAETDWIGRVREAATH